MSQTYSGFLDAFNHDLRLYLLSAFFQDFSEELSLGELRIELEELIGEEPQMINGGTLDTQIRALSDLGILVRGEPKKIINTIGNPKTVPTWKLTQSGRDFLDPVVYLINKLGMHDISLVDLYGTNRNEGISQSKIVSSILRNLKASKSYFKLEEKVTQETGIARNTFLRYVDRFIEIGLITYDKPRNSDVIYTWIGKDRVDKYQYRRMTDAYLCHEKAFMAAQELFKKGQWFTSHDLISLLPEHGLVDKTARELAAQFNNVRLAKKNTAKHYHKVSLTLEKGKDIAAIYERLRLHFEGDTLPRMELNYGALSNLLCSFAGKKINQKN